MNQASKELRQPVSTNSFDNFSRAVDEIRLRRNISKLQQLINTFDRAQRPQYLIDEIACQEEKLRLIRELRNG